MINTRALHKKTWYSLLAFAVAVLCGTQLVLANGLATKGEQIRGMESSLEALENKSKLFEDQLINLGRLERIQQDAEEVLGMVSGTGRVDYVTSPVLAVNQ